MLTLEYAIILFVSGMLQASVEDSADAVTFLYLVYAGLPKQQKEITRAQFDRSAKLVKRLEDDELFQTLCILCQHFGFYMCLRLPAPG